MIDEFAVVSRGILKEEIEQWKLKTANKRKKEEKKKLIEVIEEYRAQRRRS
jgi:predicted RNase H-like nuclease (RuvC/YqgF family)